MKKDVKDLDSKALSVDFHTWCRCLFDHDEIKGEWLLKGSEFLEEVEDGAVLDNIIILFNCFDSMVEKYSDWQISMGLMYIFSPNYSDYSFCFFEEKHSVNKRLDAIDSIKNVYKNFFNLKCHEVCLHLDEEGSETNEICFMLWDIMPFACCEDSVYEEELLSKVIETMAFATQLENIACIESGLHGLGHTVRMYPKAKDVVLEFIEKNKYSNCKLLNYAMDAKDGMIL